MLLVVLYVCMVLALYGCINVCTINALGIQLASRHAYAVCVAWLVVCISMYAFVYVHVCMSMYACVYVHECMSMYACVYVHVVMSMHVRVEVCMHACARAHVYILLVCMYVCIYANM